MMRALCLTGILWALSLGLCAQVTDCADCPCILKQAEEKVAGEYYDQAIRLFNAYKVCAPDEIAKTDERILQVFLLIEQQRDKAIAAEREAARQRDKAKRASEKANEQRIQAERLAHASSNALKALQVEKTDPTLALRMAEANYHLFPESRSASGIFSEIISNPVEGKSALKIVQGQDAYITDLACTPDGKYILAGSRDGTARLWDLNGKLVKELKGHEIGSIMVDISQDGRYLITGSQGGIVRLWDNKGGLIRIFTPEPDAITAVAFSPKYSGPDSTYQILVSNRSPFATLWDMEGNKLHSFSGHLGGINTAIFSPDGEYVITGSNDKTVMLWNLNGDILEVFSGHQSIITSLAVIPQCPEGVECDFQTPAILTASSDKTVRMWDMAGALIRSYPGHNARLLEVAYQDGIILTGDVDGLIRKWSLDGNLLKTYRGHTDFVEGIVKIPGKKQFASGAKDGTIKVWNLDGQSLHTFSKAGWHGADVAYSPNGQFAMLVSSDGDIGMWNQDGQKLLELRAYSAILALAIAPDGKRFAAGIWDGTILIYDQYGKVIREIPAHESLSDLLYSPDGQYLLSSPNGGDAILWDMSGQKVAVLEGHQSAITRLAISPDGASMLTATQNGTIRLWNKEGILKNTLKPEEAPITAAAFEPHEEQILVGYGNGNVRRFFIKGQTTLSFQAHALRINDIAYTPDGQYFVTASDDGTAAIWDQAGNKVQSLEGHRDGITSIAVSPDGRYIITGSKDNDVRLWLNTEAYLEQKVERYSLDQLQSKGLDYTQSDLLQMQKRQAERLDQNEAHFQQVKKRAKGEANLQYVNALIQLHQITGQTGHNLNFQQFEKLGRAEELSTAGFYFYRNGQWPQAKQLLQKAVKKGAGMETLIYLHQIARIQGQPFDIQPMLSQPDVEALQMGANYFEAIEEWEAAEQLYGRIIQLKERVALRYRLYQISKRMGKDRFDELFLEDSLFELRKTIDYFNRLLAFDDAPEEKREKYQLLHRLGLHAMKLTRSDDNQLEYANYTNSYGWNQILTSDFAGAEETIRTGIGYAPDYGYFYTNLPPALLFQGKYQAAEYLYRQYKDQPWTSNNSYDYYKQAFLDDLKEFEQRGIVPEEHREYMQGIVKMLEK